MNIFEVSLVAVLFLTVFGVPALVLWGWVRFARAAKSFSAAQVLSLLGMSLATASALLAVGTHAYAVSIGGFPFYDPRLLRIYGIGALLSIAGILTGIAGIWRRHPLRWIAPAVSAGMLVFWTLQASSE